MTEIPLTTGHDLGAEAKPLGPSKAPPVDMASLVPPAAMALLDELDNSRAAGTAAQAEDDDEPVTLDFVGAEPPHRTFPLRYPFRFDGVHYETVTVRQLTTGEVGRLSTVWSRDGKAPSLYDVYAEMTGLPARVLRKLPAVDGEPIVDAAYDFLPPSFRPAAG